MPRKATWAIIIWSVLMLLWAVSVGDAVGDACTAELANRGACQLGATLGGGLALSFILVVWLIGFLVLSVIWFMSRPQRRLCPACGHTAKRGEFTCRRCGFDFRTAATVQPPAGPPPGWGQPPTQQLPPPGPPPGWGQQAPQQPPPTQGPPPGWGQQNDRR
jgi:hypothetical protein